MLLSHQFKLRKQVLFYLFTLSSGVKWSPGHEVKTSISQDFPGGPGIETPNAGAQVPSLIRKLDPT